MKQWTRVVLYRAINKRVGGVMVETDGTFLGREFPWGENAEAACHAHRHHYTEADAEAVLEMVNRSGWITRDGRNPRTKEP